MEILNKINEVVLVVTKDFKSVEAKNVQIKFVKVNNDYQFELDIPKNMLTEAKLIDPDKYADTKTVFRFPIFSMVKEAMSEMCQVINNHHNQAENKREKVLFIQFTGEKSSQREITFGGDMGLDVDIHFNYFVAYKRKYIEKKHLGDDEGKEVVEYSNYCVSGMTRHKGELVRLHYMSKDRDALEKQYTIVDWTQEREDFLKALEKAFIKQCDNLNKFLQNLDSASLDHLIRNSSPIKLLQ